ncbi:MAG: hypothetical protein IJH12_05435 [Clostridia bacterium]|nr:hypothetical protein [Clostridia bacterium]
MTIFKIIIALIFLTGLPGILVVIGAGKLKTEEDRINDLEEEAEYWKEYEKNKKAK